jgi:hypothetical protein
MNLSTVLHHQQAVIVLPWVAVDLSLDLEVGIPLEILMDTSPRWMNTSPRWPCERKPKVMLEVIMLHWGRHGAMLAPFLILWVNPNASEGATGNLLGLE